MNLPIRLLPEARAEFDAAADWYEQRRTGLGLEFIGRVREAFQRITDHPEMKAAIYKDVRHQRFSNSHTWWFTASMKKRFLSLPFFTRRAIGQFGNQGYKPYETIGVVRDEHEIHRRRNPPAVR